MKKIVLYIFLFLTTFSFGQNLFVIKENGLTPKFLVSKKDTFTKNELFAKTVSWIKINEKKHNIIIEDSTKNTSINFLFTKGNKVNLNKQYFNTKYKIRINFENGQYKFQPTFIQLKINSKYDMGWKNFDLDNCTEFFKKGKVKRKYKTYLKDISKPLNQLYLLLNKYLNN